MSVNRFDSTSRLLCATPEALMPVTAAASFDAIWIVDIRRDWTTEKAETRARAALNLRKNHIQAAPTFLRIGMPDDEKGQDIISRLSTLQPSGFVLAGCSGAADVQKLDVMLRVAEAENGIETGSLAIVAEVGESPAFFLSTASMRGISERLLSFVFNGEALTQSTASQATASQATASQAVNTPAGRSGAPLLFARAVAVMKAGQAELPCYDLTLHEQLPDKDLRMLRDISIADGFSGLVARTPAQLAALAKVGPTSVSA